MIFMKIMKFYEINKNVVDNKRIKYADKLMNDLRVIESL